MSQYGEPWSLVFEMPIDCGDAGIIPASSIKRSDKPHPGHAMPMTQAELIVACVNACAGINPESIERVKLVLYRIVDHFADTDSPLGADARAALDALTAPWKYVCTESLSLHEEEEPPCDS